MNVYKTWRLFNRVIQINWPWQIFFDIMSSIPSSKLLLLPTSSGSKDKSLSWHIHSLSKNRSKFLISKLLVFGELGVSYIYLFTRTLYHMNSQHYLCLTRCVYVSVCECAKFDVEMWDCVLAKSSSWNVRILVCTYIYVFILLTLANTATICIPVRRLLDVHFTLSIHRLQEICNVMTVFWNFMPRVLCKSCHLLKARKKRLCSS